MGREITEATAQLICKNLRIPREMLPAHFVVSDEPAMAERRPYGSGLHPASKAVVACTEYTRDGCCGPRICGRSGEAVTWDDCLTCKSAEAEQGG